MMKKTILLCLCLVVACLLAVSCGQMGGNAGNNEEQSAQASQSTGQGLDIAGNWVIDDWDDVQDEGAYDPGDPWNFNPDGKFIGFGLLGDDRSEGRWSVDGSQLTITIDTTVHGESNQGEDCIWNAHVVVKADIKDFDDYSMRLSGLVYVEGTNDRGEFNKGKNRMEIKLVRSGSSRARANAEEEEDSTRME